MFDSTTPPPSYLDRQARILAAGPPPSRFARPVIDDEPLPADEEQAPPSRLAAREARMLAAGPPPSRFA